MPPVIYPEGHYITSLSGVGTEQLRAKDGHLAVLWTCHKYCPILYSWQYPILGSVSGAIQRPTVVCQQVMQGQESAKQGIL